MNTTSLETKLNQKHSEAEKTKMVSISGRWKVIDGMPQGLFINGIPFGKWSSDVSKDFKGTCKLIEKTSKKTIGYLRTTSKGVKWFKSFSALQKARALEHPQANAVKEKKSPSLKGKKIKVIPKKEFIKTLSPEKKSSNFWSLLLGLFYIIGQYLGVGREQPYNPNRSVGAISSINLGASLLQPLAYTAFLNLPGPAFSAWTTEVGPEIPISTPGTTNESPSLITNNGTFLFSWTTRNATNTSLTNVNYQLTDMKFQKLGSVNSLSSTNSSQFEPILTSLGPDYVLGVTTAPQYVDPACTNCTRGFSVSKFVHSVNVMYSPVSVFSPQTVGDFRLASVGNQIGLMWRNYSLATSARYFSSLNPLTGAQNTTWSNADNFQLWSSYDLAGGNRFASSYSYYIGNSPSNMSFSDFRFPASQTDLHTWKWTDYNNSRYPLNTICTLIDGEVSIFADEKGISSFVTQNNTVLPIWNIAQATNTTKYSDLSLACTEKWFTLGWGQKDNATANTASYIAVGDPNTNTPLVNASPINPIPSLNQTGIKLAQINNTNVVATYAKGPDIVAATIKIIQNNSSTSSPTPSNSNPSPTPFPTPPSSGSSNVPTTGQIPVSPTSGSTGKTGIIAGVIVAIVAFVALLGSIFGYAAYRRRKQKKTAPIQNVNLNSIPSNSAKENYASASKVLESGQNKSGDYQTTQLSSENHNPYANPQFSEAPKNSDYLNATPPSQYSNAPQGKPPTQYANTQPKVPYANSPVTQVGSTTQQYANAPTQPTSVLPTTQYANSPTQKTPSTQYANAPQTGNQNENAQQT